MALALVSATGSQQTGAALTQRTDPEAQIMSTNMALTCMPAGDDSRVGMSNDQVIMKHVGAVATLHHPPAMRTYRDS